MAWFALLGSTNFPAASTLSWRPEALVSSERVVAKMELAPEYAAGPHDLYAEFIEL